jgi:hypothetical protein
MHGEQRQGVFHPVEKHSAWYPSRLQHYSVDLSAWWSCIAVGSPLVRRPDVLGTPTELGRFGGDGTTGGRGLSFVSARRYFLSRWINSIWLVAIHILSRGMRDTHTTKTSHMRMASYTNTTARHAKTARSSSSPISIAKASSS